MNDAAPATTTPVRTPEPAQSPARWPILAGVWLIYMSFGLTVVGLAPLVAPITRDLAISHTTMGTILGVWQLVYIAAAVPCGILLDRLGTRKALFVGIVVIAASSALRGMATDALTLGFAVALFGIGGPIVSAGAPKVVSRWFTGSERGLAMGIYMTGPTMGSILGLSLSNSVLMPWLGGDWRTVLLVWAGVSLVAGVTWLAIMALPAVARVGRASPAAGPVVPQRQVLAELLRLPAVRLILAMAVAIFTFNHGLNNWMPELLRHGGMSPAQAGYWATVPLVVGIAGSLLIPRLATPARRYTILIALACCAILACLLLHVFWPPTLLAGLVLQGIARSSLMTVAILTLMETRGVGDERAGTASGLFFSAAEVGGASGPVLLGLVYDHTGGFDAGLTMLAGIGVLLLLGTLWLQRIERGR